MVIVDPNKRSSTSFDDLQSTEQVAKPSSTPADPVVPDLPRNQLDLTGSEQTGGPTRPAPARPQSSVAAPEISTPRPSEFITTEGTRVLFVGADHHRPQVSIKPVAPADSALQHFLEQRDEGWADNFENTDWRELGEMIRDYAETNRSILGKLGVSDWQGLSPHQAVVLARQIVQDGIGPNRAATELDGNGNRTPRARAIAQIMDELGVEELLQPGQDGVCRNYSEAFQAVFLALRVMQPKGNNQLTNSYVKLTANAGTHAWNTVFTVQRDRSVMATVLDTTRTDLHRPGETRDWEPTHDASRQYWTVRQLLAQTGDRPFRRFKELFDQGHHWKTVPPAHERGVQLSSTEQEALEAFKKRWDNGASWINLLTFEGDGEINHEELRAGANNVYDSLFVFRDAIEQLPWRARPDAFAMLEERTKKWVSSNLMGSWRISMLDLESRGGLAALDEAIGALPVPLIPAAHRSLDEEVRALLGQWRAERGKKRLPSNHPADD